MSSIMRRRSGEIFSGESCMVLLRLRYEAECLTSKLTKQNPEGQPCCQPRPKPPLPRERFSPSTPCSLSWASASGRDNVSSNGTADVVATSLTPVEIHLYK